MTSTVLALGGLFILALLIIYRIFTGYNPLRAVKINWPKRQASRRREDFIAKTVALMLDKPEVVNAVYARTQRYDSDIAYIFALLPLLLALATVEIPNKPDWFSSLMYWIFLAVGVIGVWGLGRVDDRTLLYREIIDRYEEALGMEKPM